MALYLQCKIAGSPAEQAHGLITRGRTYVQKEAADGKTVGEASGTVWGHWRTQPPVPPSCTWLTLADPGHLPEGWLFPGFRLAYQPCLVLPLQPLWP